MRAAAVANPSYPILRCALADLLIEQGSADEARAELDVLAYDGFARIPFDEEWTVSLCFLANVATGVGDKSRVSTLYELLLPAAFVVTRGTLTH